MRSNAVLAIVLATLLTAGLTLAAPTGMATTADAEFAPPDRGGPELSVPADQLAASLTCTADVADADRAPVLLLPATGVNSEDNFGWNYKPALTAAGVPWCASDVPGDYAANRNMSDIQTRAEYVTYAIRTVYERAGRPIATLGHSQGGMIARWSLRFWPDTREMVDDVIGIAPSNTGTQLARPVCTVPCQEAFFQQRSGADFMAALNSYQQTFAGISYTVIRTTYDEVVVPSAGSELSGPGDIANVVVQDKCPANVSEHLTVGTVDPVAEAAVHDALDNDGPADVERIDDGVCGELTMSGVDPKTVATDLAHAGSVLATSIAATPRVADEPALRCYTRPAGC